MLDFSADNLILSMKICMNREDFGNNLVLLFDSIELQLQELSPSNRNEVYGYIEAFVPCTKDTLIKRLRKLHLNIQVF